VKELGASIMYCICVLYDVQARSGRRTTSVCFSVRRAHLCIASSALISAK